MAFSSLPDAHRFFGGRQPIKADRYLVGNDADGPFRAVAILLINQLNPGHLPDYCCEQLLTAYGRYYSVPADKKGKASEELRRLVQHGNKVEVIQNLSFVLRQIAIDEVEEDPDKYVCILATGAEFIDPQQLRASGRPVNHWILAALGDTLHLNLRAPITEHEKTIPLDYPVNPSIRSNLRLFIHNDQYQVPVNSGFPLARSLQTLRPEPTLAQPDPAKTKRFEERIKEWRTEAEQNVLRLSTALNAGELTSEDLTDLYCRISPTTDDLQELPRGLAIASRLVTSSLFPQMDSQQTTQDVKMHFIATLAVFYPAAREILYNTLETPSHPGPR